MLTAGVHFISSWRAWWVVALGAGALSQILVVSSWTDAKLGTVANVLVLAGVVYFHASGW